MADPNFEIQKAIEAIREHAPTHLQDQLIALLRPAIALQPAPIDDDSLPVACSKFGGTPDVPAEFEWPVWLDKPLGFLAQINLEEITPFDLNHVLPATGLLSFFYDGTDGNDKEGNRVYWFEDIALLRRYESYSPIQIKPLVQTCRVTSVFYIELPRSLEDFHLIDGEMVETEWYEITRLPHDSAFYPAYFDDSENKMLGYADDYGRGSIIPDFDGDRDIELFTPPGTADYHLLLQVVSDDRLGVIWGDVGTLDFMIHKDHLAARRFEDVQLTGTNG